MIVISKSHMILHLLSATGNRALRKIVKSYFRIRDCNARQIQPKIQHEYVKSEAHGEIIIAITTHLFFQVRQNIITALIETAE